MVQVSQADDPALTAFASLDKVVLNWVTGVDALSEAVMSVIPHKIKDKAIMIVLDCIIPSPEFSIPFRPLVAWRPISPRRQPSSRMEWPPCRNCS